MVGACDGNADGSTKDGDADGCNSPVPLDVGILVGDEVINGGIVSGGSSFPTHRHVVLAITFDTRLHGSHAPIDVVALYESSSVSVTCRYPSKQIPKRKHRPRDGVRPFPTEGFSSSAAKEIEEAAS